MNKTSRGNAAKDISQFVGRFYSDLQPIKGQVRNDFANQMTQLINRDSKREQKSEQKQPTFVEESEQKNVQQGSGNTPSIHLFKNFKWYTV